MRLPKAIIPLRQLLASLALVAALALASCGGSKDKGATAPASPSAAPAEQAPLIDFKLLDHTLLERHEDRPPSVIFPDELKALDNKRISIIGFMAPFEEMDNMQHFMLLPSYVGCFFCSPPSFTQVLLVEQKSHGSGKIPFINDPIIVTGTLKLYFKESKHPAHLAEFIYALDDADVTVYTGANAPKRAAGHLQQGLLSRLQPTATTPVPGAPPHKAFQPQFLVKAVSDERRLPMMRGLKFVGEAPDALTKRIADHIASLYNPGAWKTLERACVALGFADQAFDLPKSMATLEMLRLPGYFDPLADVIYYNQDLQFSNPDARLYMVKLITEALILQNVPPRENKHRPYTQDFQFDGALADTAFLRGDVERTALLYDQKTRLLAAKPEPPAPGADVPMLLDKFSGLFIKKALGFVTKVFPADQLDKLNSAYAKPLNSTAQILHPEFYANPSSFHPNPVKWDHEELHGAKPIISDQLGEAILTVWISRFSHDEPTPTGYTGDRFAVWDGGADGDSWLIETHWADATGAEQFFNETQKLGELMLHARLADEKKAPDTYTANSDKRTFHSVLRKGRNTVYVYCARKDAEAAEIESQFVKP